MTTDQMIIFAILLATVAMFLWGRWRHDMVAAGALGASVLTGLVPSAEAFSGFGHPAVITVACVLVLSRGLQTSGVVDMLVRRALPAGAGAALTIAALTVIGALLSGFMNNVGALALLMPVAIKLARQHDLPPGRVLMPLAFGTILGGMTTLIGTPPNLIVSSFRAGTGAGEFGMFEFTPIGLAVAAAGIAFITLIGWRLVPARKEAGIEGFETGAYFTEARVSKGSKAVGKSLRDIDVALQDIDAQVIGLVRNEVRVNVPNPGRVVRADDVLVIEAEADALASALSSLGLTLEESEENQPPEDDEAAPVHPSVESANASSEPDEALDEGSVEGGNEITLVELAVLPDSPIVGRSASDIDLRSRYGIYLLAVSRHGSRSMARLRRLRFAAGDVLLMQGPRGSMAAFGTDSHCVPLAEREMHIPDQRAALTAAGIMAASVVCAALGLLPTAISFAGGVLASMALGTVPPRTVYNAIDWPVIVLLGALIPVAGAMEASGAASLIAACCSRTSRRATRWPRWHSS